MEGEIKQGEKPDSRSDSLEILFLHSFNFKKEAAALVTLLLILFIIRFETFLNLNSRFLGGYLGDAGLYIWLVKSNIETFGDLPWFNTRAFYPYTYTLAWSDNFLLPSLIVWILTYIGVGFTASYNVVLLGASLLSGFVTYYLCYVLLGGRLPALIAGAGFMSFSFLTSHLGHPQLQFAFWIPLAILFFIRFVSRKKIFDAAAAGVVVFLAFLSGTHYAILSLLTLLLMAVALFLVRPYALRAPDYLRLSIGGLLGSFPVVFFLRPYLAVKEELGNRNLYEADAFSATVLSYFSAPELNLMYGLSSVLSHPEAQLFPGFIFLGATVLVFLRLRETKRLKAISAVFILSFVAVFIFSVSEHYYRDSWLVYPLGISLWASIISFAFLIRKMGLLEAKMGFYVLTHRALIAMFLFVCLVLFAISLGPIGNPEAGKFPLGVYTLFYYLFPGMDSLRAVGRVGIITVLTGIIASSFYFFLLTQKKKAYSNFLPALLALVLAENYITAYPLEPEIPGPSVLNAFNRPPTGEDVVLILPYTRTLKADESVKSWSDFARLNTLYKNWMTGREWFLVNGYSGQRSNLMLNYPRRMSGFPDERSVNTIAYVAGLRYIVYLSHLVPDFDPVIFQEKIHRFSHALRLVTEDEDGAYLFEYVGMTPLRETFYVMVPSNPPGGFLHIELRTAQSHEQEEIVVDAFLPDSLGSAPFAAINLPADGQSYQFSIKIPETTNRVRPLKVKLLPREEEIVVFAGRRYYSGHLELYEQ